MYHKPLLKDFNKLNELAQDQIQCWAIVFTMLNFRVTKI
jgi:hypothetical protein